MIAHYMPIEQHTGLFKLIVKNFDTLGGLLTFLLAGNKDHYFANYLVGVVILDYLFVK